MKEEKSRALARRFAVAIAAVGCSGALACDESKTKEEAPAAPAAPAAGEDEAGKNEAAAPEGKSDDAAAAATKADDDAPKEKGSASLSIGGEAWTADRASARRKEKRLSISASRMTMADGKANRQALSLVVQDFDGPGDYEAAAGSTFVGVGLDVDAAKAAEGDDAKTTEVAKKALTSADIVMLMGATVKIASATDDRVTGSVSWKARPGSKGPASLDGTFEAILK